MLDNKRFCCGFLRDKWVCFVKNAFVLISAIGFVLQKSSFIEAQSSLVSIVIVLDSGATEVEIHVHDRQGQNRRTRSRRLEAL
jgi:hypothetical protein